MLKLMLTSISNVRATLPIGPVGPSRLSSRPDFGLVQIGVAEDQMSVPISFSPVIVIVTAAGGSVAGSRTVWQSLHLCLCKGRGLRWPGSHRSAAGCALASAAT